MRLTRSRSDKFLGGVCGGIGRYLGIDSTVIRLVFLLLLFASGIGFWIYLILWIVIPVEGEPAPSGTAGERLSAGVRGMGEDIRLAAQSPNPQAGIWFGVALVIVGGLLFLQQINQQLHLIWLNWLSLDNLWPLLLIVLGAVLLARGLRKGD